jgi:hypothetical protein
VRVTRISARHPADVAIEVELGLKAGYRCFVLERAGSGQMLDQERLGAARYAAGVHSQVELAADDSSVSSGSSGSLAAEASARVEAR